MLSIHLDDEVVGSRDEQVGAVGSEQAEERIDCRVVDGVYLAYNFASTLVDDLKANDSSPREFLSIGVYVLAWEVDIATRQLAYTLLRVDIGEAHECRFVVLKAIFVEEERHEDAVDVENEVVGIYAVEDVIVEVERHLAVHTVRFAYLTYLIYCFFLYHFFVS